MRKTRLEPSCFAAAMALLLGLAGLGCTAIVYAAELPPPLDAPYPGTLKLQVDATDLDHHVFRVHEEIPARPGSLILLYPQWIPGNHAPTGPIDDLAGLMIQANGKKLQWWRDTSNVYAFHVEVPAGAAAVEVEFEYFSPLDVSQGRVMMTPDILDLQWDKVALYPAGHDASRVRIAASAMLPSGWGFATALERDNAPGRRAIGFKPVDFATFVDSPLYAGRYFKRIDLDPGSQVPVHLNLFADEPRYLELEPELLQALRALVQQEYKLQGSHHYDHYDFLLALSNTFSRIGLEHHRSSENGTDVAYLRDWKSRAFIGYGIPHEYTHSWNGKFRRPADLATPNFNVTMGNRLLWVYEGLTEYWGDVLAARAGLESAAQARDELAIVAAGYAVDRPGFAWRNVEDTTNDPVIRRHIPPYRGYLMDAEYYSAGALIWLAVDAKLRELSHDAKSLDDFARAFFGVDNGDWKVKTYTFDDVVATLNAIAPHDWATFLRARLDANAPPLDGLAAAGWKLAYTDEESQSQKNFERGLKSVDLSTSIGLVIANEGSRISDVRWNGPAFKAGIAPGGTLIAVNGREYQSERLIYALREAESGDAPVDLLVKSGDQYKTFPVYYHDGLKYPHLVRIPGTIDRLGMILAPR